MTKRFDLEQKLLDCWHITDDLDTIADAVLEQDLTNDDVANLLIGLSKLYHLKFEKTFRTFEGFISEKR